MKTFVKLVLFASALALPVRALCSSAWVARAFAGTQDYVQIDDGVYAAPDLPLDERRRALAALRAARGRIADTFGPPVARPTTIIAADDREAACLGLADGVPGTAFISPLRTEVVLNLAHFSVDVTAHELVHAEVAQRLGFWTRAVKLPVWFDEGAAVQHASLARLTGGARFDDVFGPEPVSP